jgi:hypothetical protein
MVDSILQRDHGLNRVGLRDRPQSLSKLRSFHRDPENVHGRHFAGDCDVCFESSERAVEMKSPWILRDFFVANDERDGCARMCQTDTDHTSNAAGAKNRVPQCSGIRCSHLGLDRRDSALLQGCRQTFDYFGVAQCVVAGFGALVNALDQFLARWDATPLQPEQDV